MKIAIIEPNLSLPYGTPRFALNVAGALKKIGHKVVIYTNEFSDKAFPELIDGLEIKVISPEAREEDFRGAKTIIGKLIQRWQRRALSIKNSEIIVNAMDKDFDIVDCQNLYTYRVGCLYKTRINRKTKVIWSLYDVPWIYRPTGKFFYDFPRELNARAEEFLESKFYKDVDKVILLENRNYPIAERMGFPSKKISRILFSGTDDWFYSTVKDISKTREIRILSVGSLGPYRRYEDIISAVSILKKKGIPAKATLICRVSPDTFLYKEEIVRFTESLGVLEDIDFRFNGASDEELKKAQKDSYFYVSPNAIGIWSMAAFEAMVAGLLLVVSRITSNAEVLKDKESVCALFIDPCKPEDIAEKIEWAVKKPEEYRNIASAGQKFVRENLTWEKYAKHLIDAVK